MSERTSYLEDATVLAEEGWALIPLIQGGKAPLIKEWQRRGTNDPGQIARWWKANPLANIGVVCGLSGLVVIDLDVKNGMSGPAVWQRLCRDLGISPWNTAMVSTPSGGRHLYYTAPEGTDLGNNTGKLGAGIDVRANGGYVVAPPSATKDGSYTWLSRRPLVPLPTAILRKLQTQTSPEASPPRQDTARRKSAYVRTAVKAEVERVANAKEGSRNHTLNAAAFSLGRLAGSSWAHLDPETVRDELLHAARRCGLPDSEAMATIESGLSSGLSHPRPEPQPGSAGRRPSSSRQKAGASGKQIGSTEYMRVLSSLGYSFRMNVCNDRVFVNGEPMTDALAAKIRTQMRDLGYTHMPAIEDACIAEAYDQRWHPVQEYLDGLTWDGHDHIAELASHFTDQRGVFPLFLDRWLIGAVAKVDCAEQNRVLILDGEQNLGKSHFVRWLCSPLPRLLVEGPINPEDKDDQLRLISCWIWEVAELGSTTRKADREALKHFLTVRQVTVRKPYGRHDLVKPALASFIGTVNNEAGILSDPTGSRRFMSVHLLSIDWSYTQMDVNQVWAQAVALYRAGEPWDLEGEEKAQAEEANADYEVENPLTGYVRRCFTITGDPNDRVPTCDILDRLHDTGWAGLRSPTAESMELAGVLKKMGAEQYRTNEGRGWCGLVSRIHCN